MLVPVSPSGTGKTLSRLTSSWLAESQLRLPRRARLKRGPSTPGILLSATLAALFANALDVHVDLRDRHVDRPFHLEFDRLLQVAGHLRDANPVLDDDPQLDAETALDLDHPAALVAIFPTYQLPHPITQPAPSLSHPPIPPHP